MFNSGVSLLSHLLLFLFTIIAALQNPRLVHGVAENETMVPLIEPNLIKDFVLAPNDTRRRLRGFQICALCTCCGGARGLCLPSPCCYAINCNIPNRPFGLCALQPKTCNCFGCHL